MPAGDEVFERDVNTKEDVTNKYPRNVVNDELCSLIKTILVLLKEDDKKIVKRNKHQNDNHVETSVLHCEQIPVVSSSKLGKCSHVQIFVFHIGFAVSPEPECEDTKYSWSYEPVKPLLVVHFSKLKV